MRICALYDTHLIPHNHLSRLHQHLCVLHHAARCVGVDAGQLFRVSDCQSGITHPHARALQHGGRVEGMQDVLLRAGGHGTGLTECRIHSACKGWQLADTQNFRP